MKIYGYNLILFGRNKKGERISCCVKSNNSFSHHGSLSENFESILNGIFLLTSLLIKLGIIYRLLKPYLEIYSAFVLTHQINNPTRSTLKTLSLLDYILTNSKEFNGHLFKILQDTINDG